MGSSNWAAKEAQQKAVETILSMNHVHETWDGYRFYLSNITPVDESEPQRVQIVVNHDPAKYLLTYPGAVAVAIGIFLLFWFFSQREQRGY